MSKAKADLSDVRKIPHQGDDPVAEQHVHRTLWRQFGPEVEVMAPLKGLVHAVFTPLLVDPVRDQYFGEIIVKWMLFMVPAWIYLLFYSDPVNHPFIFAAVSAYYLFTWLDQLIVYISSLHCLVHRRAFKGHAQGAVKVLYSWFFGPMFGLTPETYQSHHVGMHHVRNNGFKDTSSTMLYRRDSVTGYLRYILRFYLSYVETSQSLIELGNTKALKKFFAGEVSWLVCGLLLAFYRPTPAAVVAWFFPMVVARIGMSTGNFAQHAFINDANPHENMNLSSVIVDSDYNTGAFNDGYHILHHMYPSAHYMDLPKLFVSELPKLAEHDSTVFTAKRQWGPLLDWPSITMLLLKGRYDILADHFLDCRAIVNKTKPRPRDEIIALLKSRTSKVYTAPPAPTTAG